VTNGFIQNVVPMRNGTAAISRHGTFYYCPPFFKQWITTPARLKDICMHEAMHPVIGDMTREYDDMANIGGDAIINAMLFNMGMCECEFQQAFYSSNRAPLCLLRPYSHPDPKYVPFYASLYPRTVQNRDKYQAANPLEFTNGLRIAAKADEELEMGNIIDWLLGSHYRGEEPGDQLIDWDGDPIDMDEMSMPGEVQGDLADNMKQKIEHVDCMTGGQGSILGDLSLSILKSKRSLQTEVVKGFATNNAMNKLKQYFKSPKVRRSVVPIKVTRSQAMQIAAGRPPLFYQRISMKEEAIVKAGIDFYLDVSGSVWDSLPQIISLFRKLKNDVRSVLLFSNRVVEIPIDKLLSGNIRDSTTGGTDFDCVIEDAVKRKSKKILILTDGGADANPHSRRLAKRHIAKAGIVFFGSWRAEKNWISRHYKCSYELEELIA